MKILSNASEYGIRALLYLASRSQNNEFISIGKISEDLNISFHFLTKICQTLVQHGLLESARGPAGGITFKRPPTQILLSEVILALEGKNFFDKCVLGLPGCGDRKPCPFHAFWRVMKLTVKSEFETTTLATLSSQMLENDLRINPC